MTTLFIFATLAAFINFKEIKSMTKKLLFVFVGFMVVACGEQGKSQSATSLAATEPTPAPVVADEAPVAPSSPADVVAKINGVDVTDAELTARVKNQLSRLESQIFDIKSGGLTDLIDEKLLEAEAAKRKLSVDELLKKEIDSKIQQPSEQEIQTFFSLFQENKYKGKTLDQVKGELVNQIKSTRRRDLYSGLMKGLKKDSKIEILMERPRIKVAVNKESPSRGKDDAPILIYEFSEFQCPFCKKVQPTMTQIEQEYKGKVKRVFRHFPLSFHQQARGAGLASLCANEQGKFWAYAEILWEHQRELEPEKLKEYAGQASLDTGKFNKCLDSAKFESEIVEDQNVGSATGVSGTPAFFINGIFLSGAQPFEKFQEVIEQELLTQGK